MTMPRIMSAIFITAVLTLATFAEAGEEGDTIFQTSTIDALMDGVYDGDFTFGALKKRGDFGIGTFNGLDGEMIAVDGVFYRVRSDGKVFVAPDAARTPFAAVTFFEADRTVTLAKEMSCKELEDYIETLLPSKNIFYALRVEGSFKNVKTRSVPKQERPFPPLTEAVKRQSYFELEDARGTMAGFWLPEYVKNLNAAGFHLHFITSDKEAGGHVLGCTTGDVKIEIDYSTGLDISLPETSDFLNADLTITDGKEVKAAEEEKK